MPLGCEQFQGWRGSKCQTFFQVIVEFSLYCSRSALLLQGGRQLSCSSPTSLGQIKPFWCQHPTPSWGINTWLCHAHEHASMSKKQGICIRCRESYRHQNFPILCPPCEKVIDYSLFSPLYCHLSKVLALRVTGVSDSRNGEKWASSGSAWLSLGPQISFQTPGSNFPMGRSISGHGALWIHKYFINSNSFLEANTEGPSTCLPALWLQSHLL